MPKLKISLPESQINFLAARARRDRVSISEVVQRLVEQEAEVERKQEPPEAFLALAGILDDTQPLINGVPVSEDPNLYLVARKLSAADPVDQPVGRAPKIGIKLVMFAAEPAPDQGL